MDRRKLLSKLRRAELLELPIFTSRDSSKTVPQLRIKLFNELVRLNVHSYGARVGDLLRAHERIRDSARALAQAAAEKVSQIQAKKNQAKAMAEAAAKKVAAKNKAIDDAFFKQLRESTPTDLTDYSKYKGDDKKFYQKWFSKYVRHFKKNEGVKVCITDNAEKSKALEDAIIWLSKQNLVDQKVFIGSSDLSGRTIERTLMTENKSKIQDMLSVLSGRLTVKYDDTNSPCDYDENDAIFVPDFFEVKFRTVVKKGKQTKIQGKTADYTAGDDKPTYIEIDLDEMMNDVRGGAFWKWLNKSPINLEQYQIFSELDAKHYVDNCFIYACKKSGLFSETDIENMINIVKVNRIPLKKIKEIAETYKVYIEISVIYDTEGTHGKTITYGNRSWPKLSLLLMKEHYMLNEKVDVSTFYIKNFKMLHELFPDMPQEKIQRIVRLDDRRNVPTVKEYTKTGTLLSTVLYLLFELNLMEPIKNMEEIIAIKAANQEKFEDYSNLEYNEKTCCRPIEGASSKKVGPSPGSGGIFFSDFETDTTTNPHTPYLNVTIGANSAVAFHGENCGKDLLNYLPNNSLTYFHNLKYDSCFIHNQTENAEVKVTERSGTVIQMIVKYPHKRLTFRDSYSLIPSKLANFSDLFGLKVHKEVMAYKLYTKENRERRIIPLSEYNEHLALENANKTSAEIAQLQEQLKENAIKAKCLESSTNDELVLDIIKYAQFYCVRDCIVLKQGIEKFDKDLKTVFESYNCNYPGIYSYLSISALGYSLTKLFGCFDECFELSGKPQNFIQRCVNGGRTMTANNKKLIVEANSEYGTIQDFDAVSLYPSAMKFMPGIPKGMPKVLTPDLARAIEENAQAPELTDYFVEIDIHELSPKSDYPYAFGLVWKCASSGSKMYGNDARENYYITKRELLDLVEFYNIKYTVKRGYYFNEGFNNKINSFIENLFQLRLKYKKEKNPLEKTIKLLLNSIYGKSILKPIDTEIKSIPKANLERFVIRNYNYIKSIELTSGASSRAHIKLNKAINRHFNLPQFGANVLAWSKHLMNRVMCTAEQSGIKIFYQDTDSMHLYENDIDKLSKIFENKYGTKLIGTDLCQFHSDFDSISPNSSKVWSKKLIALGKKSYLDILQDDLGNTGYHIRLKGIPNQCILNYCRDNSLTVEELYMKMYEGEMIVFDIRNGSQCFQKTRTFEQITREVFKRRVKF